MNILFLNPPFGTQRPEGLDAPMGIMYLSSVLKEAGHTCSIVDNVWETQDDWSAWEAALEHQPDLVLINTQIRFEDDSRAAVLKARQLSPQSALIAFGPQASTEARKLLNDLGLDACVIGEPERITTQMCSFAHHIANGSSPDSPEPIIGLATPEHPSPGYAPRVDVETLPFPDWNLADYRRYIQTTHNAVVMCSRGSNRSDAFYQPPLIYATTPTSRCSVERVATELAELRRRFPGTYMVLFHDEVFTEDRDWVLALCDMLRRKRFGVPYWCFTRPDMIDKELCLAMRRAGFIGVSMGMESASDKVLEILGRNLTRSQIERGFRAATSAGLLTVGSVMIGTPGESTQDIHQTSELVRSLHPDVLTISLTTPLPGTELFEQYNNRILGTSPEDFNYYHVWTGKYPMQLEDLTKHDLAEGVVTIRAGWKRGLWKTALRTATAALRNRAFRKNLLSQVLRVGKRKLVQTADEKTETN